MTKRNGVRYTQEYKTAITKRMMPPHNEGVATPGNGQTSDKWNSQDKFLVVMETFSMNELELGAYCRKKGLYCEQIEAWKASCLQANGKTVDQSKKLNGVLKEEQKRGKELEKELQKKEKALAEAAALLLLRKKAQAIWGDDAEE